MPRRDGITRVLPSEPDYAEICRRQGLGHLLEERPVTPNGVGKVNGIEEGEGDGEVSPRSGVPVVNGVNGGSHD